MEYVWAAGICTGLLMALFAAFPLAVAWRNTRGSTIRHALVWAWIAWLAWMWYGLRGGPIAAYGALTFTAAAGIAVLGARRPGVAAWHFVVIGLLVVLWLPWAEQYLLGNRLRIVGIRQVFLWSLLVLALGNYLATRIGISALLLLFACGLVQKLSRIADVVDEPDEDFRLLIHRLFYVGSLMAITALPAMLAILRPRPGSATDQLWSRFRDTFGAVWALRLREPFNTAAQNAGWPVRLGWFGLVPKTENPAPEWHDTLVALQKRFGSE